MWGLKGCVYLIANKIGLNRRLPLSIIKYDKAF